MNHKHLLQLVVVALLMAVGVGGVATRSASAADASRPFTAAISGTVSITGDTTFELDGTLKATHMGNHLDYHANGTFTGPDTDTLTETLVAANGDTLVLLCQQVLEATAPGVYHGTDTWTVIGGTGRFSSATGSGTGATKADLNAGTFTKQMTGVITY